MEIFIKAVLLPLQFQLQLHVSTSPAGTNNCLALTTDKYLSYRKVCKLAVPESIFARRTRILRRAKPSPPWRWIIIDSRIIHKSSLIRRTAIIVEMDPVRVGSASIQNKNIGGACVKRAVIRQCTWAHRLKVPSSNVRLHPSARHHYLALNWPIISLWISGSRWRQQFAGALNFSPFHQFIFRFVSACSPPAPRKTTSSINVINK